MALEYSSGGYPIVRTADGTRLVIGNKVMAISDGQTYYVVDIQPDGTLNLGKLPQTATVRMEKGTNLKIVTGGRRRKTRKSKRRSRKTRRRYT